MPFTIFHCFAHQVAYPHHHCLVGRGSMEWDCLTLLHNSSSGNRTPDLRISDFESNALSTWPHALKLVSIFFSAAKVAQQVLFKWTRQRGQSGQQKRNTVIFCLSEVYWIYNSTEANCFQSYHESKISYGSTAQDFVFLLLFVACILCTGHDQMKGATRTNFCKNPIMIVPLMILREPVMFEELSRTYWLTTCLLLVYTSLWR